MVQWEDIIGSDDWNERDEDCDRCRAWTVGWVIEETDEYVKLGSTYDWDAGTWHTKHIFPKRVPVREHLRRAGEGWVLKVERLS